MPEMRSHGIGRVFLCNHAADFAAVVLVTLGIWLARYPDRALITGLEAAALLTVVCLTYGYLAMQREIAMKRNEAYFRSLFENALNLITVLDARGNIA